ncbi:MAG TPA: colicin transporter, partial [Bradyrhizobium sp.]|nr:colicin transporter [Bradyrhizobium sp.]
MTTRLLSTVSCAAIATALFYVSAVPAIAQDAACAPVSAVDTAPPPLPTYDQPPVPGPGYMWSPGNWSWDEDRGDYYWVPGTWVQPPRVGLLWTPGYWGAFGGG